MLYCDEYEKKILKLKIKVKNFIRLNYQYYILKVLEFLKAKQFLKNMIISFLYTITSQYKNKPNHSKKNKQND